MVIGNLYIIRVHDCLLYVNIIVPHIILCSLSLSLSPSFFSLCHTRTCLYAHRVGGVNVCYLPCSGESRLLHNFTSAGIGVPASWFSSRPPLGNLPYCLWVVAPLINQLNSTSQTFESFSSSQFYSSLGSDILNFHSHSDFRILLQFNNSQTSLCYDETVLIYSGLPEFLTPFNSLLTPYSPNTVVQDGSLVGAFTGAQLKDHSLSLFSSVLTVVYYSSTTPHSRLQGFNLMVTVEWPTGENDTDPVNATSEQVTLKYNCMPHVWEF